MGIFSGYNRQYPLTGHPSGTPEKFGEYLLFGRKLFRIRQMLPATPPTCAENRTYRNSAPLCRFEELNQFPFQVGALLFPNPDPRRIAWCRIGDKTGLTVNVSQPGPPEGHFLNSYDCVDHQPVYELPFCRLAVANSELINFLGKLGDER